MEVTYELTPEDVWQFNLYYRRYKMRLRPLFRNAFLGVMISVFVGSFGLDGFLWLRTGQISWPILLSLTGLGWYVYRSLLFLPTRGRAMKLARRSPGLLCEHTIAISPLWLSEKTDVNETKIAWKTIHSVEEDADYGFLFIGKANAFIIPKRAFGSRAEAQSFLDKSRQYWEAAKAGQTASSEDTGTWPPPPQSVK